MHIGVDYYPEHWPHERWETDAIMMHEAGFNTVRMAEFAWSEMEPNEGEFNFGWLDSASNSTDWKSQSWRSHNVLSRCFSPRSKVRLAGRRWRSTCGSPRFGSAHFDATCSS